MPAQVQRLGTDVQQLEAESQRLLSQAEMGQVNGRSEASSYGGGRGAQAVHSLELLDFSPNWDFTLGGSKVHLSPSVSALAALMPLMTSARSEHLQQILNPPSMLAGHACCSSCFLCYVLCIGWPVLPPMV